jgi:hypothetical protein
MAMHFENAILPTPKCTFDDLRVNRLTRSPHPAFSADLAPSDFYLFGKLTMTLMSAVFADADELL